MNAQLLYTELEQLSREAVRNKRSSRIIVRLSFLILVELGIYYILSGIIVVFRRCTRLLLLRLQDDRTRVGVVARQDFWRSVCHCVVLQDGL